MDTTLLVVGIIVLIAIVGLAVVVLMAGTKKNRMSVGPASANLRSLVSAQRAQAQADGGKIQSKAGKDNLAVAAAAESNLSRKKLQSSSRLTLEKRIRYAQWSITPLQFRAIQVFATLTVFIPAYMNFAASIWALTLFMTPLIVSGALDYGVNRRFKAFDADYPVLLLSFVSLLKTGMSTISGLEAAAKGLEPESLVRAEVELLVERLRLGLTEEQAINAFGEDVAHPELELFVQSLLLSRKVGGTLSQTLERLAKQVRKRQQFRQQAVAVVGMERSSIYAIAGIMTALMCYLLYASPELVMPAIRNPTGWKIFQGGISLIIFGFYWSRKVTNIKI